MIQRIKTAYINAELRHPRLAKWARFIIAGGTGAAVNIGVLFALTHWIGLWYLASSIIAFILSIIVSFIFQKFWTFREATTDMIHVQAMWYILLALVNLGLNTLILYLSVDIIGLHYILAQIIASGLIAIESYLVYRKIFARAILLQ